MNITALIQSNAIRTYLESIRHPFSSLEAAWVIHHNTTLSLEEKHTLWTEIITTMPDHIFSAEGVTTSVHTQLREQIKLEQQLLKLFLTPDDRYYYDYGLKYYDLGGRVRWRTDSAMYFDYQCCYEALCEDLEGDDGALCSRITKYCEENPQQKITVTLSADAKAFLRIKERDILNDEESSISKMLNYIQVHLPLPFKRGDILTKADLSIRATVNYPLVFGGTEGTEYLLGYSMESCYRVNRHILRDYLALEYYTGELRNTERALKAMSDYYKGRIHIGDYSNVYHTIMLEDHLQDVQSSVYKEMAWTVLPTNDTTQK